MLAKTKRLTSAEVREIMHSGRSLRSGTLVAKYLPGSKGQAAAVVSKKVAGSAVERNRIRRTLYRTLRSCLPKAKIVFTVTKVADDYTADLLALCSKLS